MNDRVEILVGSICSQNTLAVQSQIMHLRSPRIEGTQTEYLQKNLIDYLLEARGLLSARTLGSFELLVAKANLLIPGTIPEIPGTIQAQG